LCVTERRHRPSPLSLSVYALRCRGLFLIPSSLFLVVYSHLTSSRHQDYFPGRPSPGGWLAKQRCLRRSLRGGPRYRFGISWRTCASWFSQIVLCCWQFLVLAVFDDSYLGALPLVVSLQRGGIHSFLIRCQRPFSVRSGSIVQPAHRFQCWHLSAATVVQGALRCFALLCFLRTPHCGHPYRDH
jgi:hypothetical protein